VVYAATKAVVSGELPSGSPFPSVREFSQALKINPNTAHKIVAELTRQGLLEVMPGLGTVVAGGRPATAQERTDLLSLEVEQLVVEAKRLGVGESDLLEAVRARWAELSAGSTTAPNSPNSPNSPNPSDAPKSASKMPPRTDHTVRDTEQDVLNEAGASAISGSNA
jgi:GntR family transcriptional regulator